MFMDTVKAVAKKNKPKVDMEHYRAKIKKKLLKEAKKGLEECRVWLPCTLDIDEFNELLKEDNLECLFLHNNLNNTKYKVYVGERLDPKKFWSLVEYNRQQHNRKNK